MNSEYRTIDDKEKLNNIKSKIGFENIKSKYILQKLFEHIKKNKSFEIFKYNKKIQKRLNISINDYKKYSEECTPIEIEIIPIKECYNKK